MRLFITIFGKGRKPVVAPALVALTFGWGASSVTAAPATTAPASLAPATTMPNVTVPLPSTSGSPATTPGLIKPKKKAATGKSGSSVIVNGFIGSVIAGDVNVRSGPGMAYYVLGQLKQGDLVQVEGSRNGWDAISPPAGTLCYIAKKFVHVGSDTTKGRVSANYVYVRAASELVPHADYAVVKVVHRGTKVRIAGSTPSFFVIEPPHGAHVYVLAKFIKPAGDATEFITPKLHMPAGFKGSTLAADLTPGTATAIASMSGTTSSVTTTSPQAVITPTTQTSGMDVGGSAVVPLPTTQTKSQGNAVNSSGGISAVPVAPTSIKPVESTQLSIYSQFSALNKKTQLEFQKPLAQRELMPLLNGYEKLSAVMSAPTWIKQGSMARIRVLKKAIAIQQLIKSNHANAPVSTVIAPYQQQWKESQSQIAQAIAHAPYVARGILRTSTVLKSKYVLVDPSTGRVTAYVNPTSRIDISKLIGSYIGVKGLATGGGDVVKVVSVTTATLLPEPQVAQYKTTSNMQHP